MQMLETESRRTQPLALVALGIGDTRLLWCLRRLAMMAPIESARCQAVHVALQREYGDAGLGIEHLLRCLLVGLARRASRRLAIGTPGCALLTSDEAALLALFVAPSNAALVALAGDAAAPLLPLCRALQTLVAEEPRHVYALM